MKTLTPKSIRPGGTSCPYGTFQRALTATRLPVRVAYSHPAAFIRAMSGRLAKEARFGMKHRRARRAYYAAAWKHLLSELDTIKIYSL